MIPFLRKYAVEIVAAIGTITTLATALGLSRQHYVSVVLGVLSTVAVILTKFFTVTRPAKASAHDRVRAAAKDLIASDPTAKVTITRGAETETPK